MNQDTHTLHRVGKNKGEERREKKIKTSRDSALVDVITSEMLMLKISEQREMKIRDLLCSALSRDKRERQLSEQLSSVPREARRERESENSNSLLSLSPLFSESMSADVSKTTDNHD